MPGKGEGGKTIEGGKGEGESMPPYLPRTKRERTRPNTPARRHGKRKAPRPGEKRERPPPRRPETVPETATGPATLPAVVIAVTHARKPAAPPRFGIGLPPPKRQPPHAPLPIHLFHSALGTAPTYFILISKRPGGSPWRTELRFRLDTGVVGLRSGRWLTRRFDASWDKSCVRVLTKLRMVW